MSETKPSLVQITLRLISGLLALLSFALFAVRLYGYSVLDIQTGVEGVMSSLRLLFPLSLGLIFGYLAVKGRFPFSDDTTKRKESDE
ncbi:MAG: hypothetical protein ABFS45_13665 [Pseudomonadota bacterium]